MTLCLRCIDANSNEILAPRQDFLVGFACLFVSSSCTCRDKNMSNAIPPTLAPHLQECLDTPSLALLTSVLGTPTNWLVVSFLHLALRGNRKVSSTNSGTLTSSPEHKVILISLWRSLDFWNEIAKKCVSPAKSDTASAKG